ncbi:PilX N-terminal domain-containing pilus assembly protein [Pseudomonas sp. NPDC077186]|uniref:pilus assembly PilX family protein n=1 Tax=Pseudomonas sp. NPDC077186 TaxID=3364421 RepID=UPI0037C8F887
MNITPPPRQTGATLIVALVFLVVLTIAGITAMQFSTLEERMASNSQFRNQTFQQAQNEINSELRDLNLGLTGRIPLLQALSSGRFNDGDPSDGYPWYTSPEQLKNLGLPPTTSGKAINTPSPLAPGFTVIRKTHDPMLCSHSERNASGQIIECTKFEIQTRAELGNGAYSEQSQGIVFENIKG